MTTAVAPWASAPTPRGLPFALAVSLAIHVALYVAVLSHTHRPAPREKATEISLEVHEIERPKPPPPEPKPEKVPAQKIQRMVAKLAKPPPHEAPPPPNQPPPKPSTEPPPPIRIGVNLESTVAGGGFAAPVGNSMYGQAPVQASPPAEVKPYWAAKFMPPSQVSELPQLLDEVKADYPAQARKDGIEGDVVLMVTVDDQGKVAKVKKVSGVGHGLDEAAIEALRHFRFKPARYNGQPVATEFRYTYSWEID